MSKCQTDTITHFLAVQWDSGAGLGPATSSLSPLFLSDLLLHLVVLTSDGESWLPHIPSGPVIINCVAVGRAAAAIAVAVPIAKNNRSGVVGEGASKSSNGSSMEGVMHMIYLAVSWYLKYKMALAKTAPTLMLMIYMCCIWSTSCSSWSTYPLSSAERKIFNRSYAYPFFGGRGGVMLVIYLSFSSCQQSSKRSCLLLSPK